MENSRSLLLKARLAMVRRDLDPIVSRLTQDILDWAPAAGMRTIAGQLVEVAITEMQLVARLKDGHQISDAAAKEMLGDCDSLDNLRGALIDVRQQTLAYLDSLSEAELAEEISINGGCFASLMLPTAPRPEIFVNIADREWYYVGQLTSYFWARPVTQCTG